MNYSAGVLIGIGGIAIILAVRNSYKNIWQEITGSPTPSNTGQQTGGSAVTTFGGNLNNNDLRTLAQQDAVKAGIDPTKFLNQIQQESGFNPNAVSSAGAEGIAQYMPATAASQGINPFDPVAALQGAANYMAQLIKKYGGSEAMGLAAYNAGSGTVDSALAQSKATGKPWYDFIPLETQNYIIDINNGSFN